MNALKNQSLKVSEIFFSLQGEGARAGSANVFIRLQGCKAKDACVEMTLEEIHAWIIRQAPQARSIIWTGGEPAQQLTSEIVEFFNDKNFYQAIETSGLFPVPGNLDWVSVSPKVAEHVVKKNFPKGVSELRYVRHAGQAIPQPSVEAAFYFLSPHSDGFELNAENLKHCIELCRLHPNWRLSVQMHKLWRVL